MTDHERSEAASHRAPIGVGLLVALLAAAGCESTPRTPEETMDQLRERLADKLPDGWQVGYVRDAAFAVRDEVLNVGDLSAYREKPQSGDLVAWRTEPVKLQHRTNLPPPEPDPGHVYFVLSAKPLIAPAEYADVSKKNQDALDRRKTLLRDVSNVSRDASGNFLPRGQAESGQVNSFRAKYAKLPPHDAFLPRYYYENTAVRLRDYRTVLVPETREHMREMNTTYVTLLEVLTPYGQ